MGRGVGLEEVWRELGREEEACWVGVGLIGMEVGREEGVCWVGAGLIGIAVGRAVVVGIGGEKGENKGSFVGPASGFTPNG